MSGSVSGIGLGLGIAQTVANNGFQGTLTGVVIGTAHYYREPNSTDRPNIVITDEPKAR
jgi:hypothetical protein